MTTTADQIDIIVPGEANLAIDSISSLQGSDVLWVGQEQGTVPKTITLAQIREYVRSGNLGTTPSGMFFPASSANPDGLAYIIATTPPSQRPADMLPTGVTTVLQTGDRWYDTSTALEWVRRANYWIQPLEEMQLLSLMQNNPFCYGGTAWINETKGGSSSSSVSELAGLSCWLHNPQASGIFLEFMTTRYFTPEAVLLGGYSYTCWIENINNSMVPQSYYNVVNTFADMTLPPNNPVTQGNAEVKTQTPLQTINWIPVTNSTATQGLALIRSNTVTYVRQLYVASNSIRITLKDFRSQRGSNGQSPSPLLIGATLFFHWSV